MALRPFKLRRALWSAVLLAGLSLVWPAAQASALTYGEEKELGRQVFASIKKNMKLVEDQAISTYVNDLGHKMLKAFGPQPFEFRFFVLQSDVINAFATPGGYIFIHSGLINAMEREGQLASIISHEISHVTSRHISERIAKGRSLSLATLGGVMAGIFLGGAAGQALMMGSVAGNMQMQLAYSRQDEREADRKGLDNLVKAGYDPKFMVEAFEILLRNAWHASDNIPTYLTTHPGLSERISSVENSVISHPGYQIVHGCGDDKTFQAIKTRVMALLADPKRAQNYFEAMRRKDPDNALAHYGLAMLYQQQQDFDMAEREFRSALEADPANPCILSDLGTMLFQKKDFSGAMSVLIRAVVLRPNMVQALYMLARTYEEQGLTDRAEKLYARVLVQNPKHPDALYRMGLIYGRRGDLARAHLHTGLYFQTQGQDKKALFHFKKAKEKAGSAPPPVKARIETAIRETQSKEKHKQDGF
ncbi:MAG: M48 family metalloprotease [Thermodesulfobacteriota bacterium]|nr:M48 family metalloprotease [Thermodesulfobacteriota bacterium]